MGDISEALSKIESDVCKVCEFKLVEIGDQEALLDHLRVCEGCKKVSKSWVEDKPEVSEQMCFAGKQLVEDLLREVLKKED